MPDSGGFTEEDTLLFVSQDTADDRFFLCSMQGREALSQLYEFQIMVQCDSPLDTGEIDTLLQKPAYIALDRVAERKIHGVLRAVELIPQFDLTVVRYLLTLVPRLWYLTQCTRSRIYQAQSIPDVVKAVLTDAGLEEGTDFELKVSGRHPVREYVVQHEETDFQFVSRWLEYEGMFYYFDHDGEVEKLVIGDSNTAFAALPGRDTLPFAHSAGVVDVEESVHDLRRTTQVVPRRMHIREFRTQLPANVMTHDADVAIDEAQWPSDRVGHGLQVFFGEHVASAGDAGRIAQLRAEEALCRKVTYAGRSGVRGLHAGFKFTLDGHFLDELGAEYVVTEMHHAVDQEALMGARRDEAGGRMGYSNEFEAIQSATVYRPARLTPRPRVSGMTYAVVDGPNTDQTAHIDDAGRYRVVMPYDTIAEPNKGKATLPIRMAQSYAGPGYGIHFPLHQGTQVLIVHVHGDPDRPVIAAALPNPSTPSPVVSPENTTSKILTRSKILMRFDDDA